MGLTTVQQELYGAVSAIPGPRTPYWNMFSNANTPFLSRANTIKIDELFIALSEAGIIPRGVKSPIIAIDGENTLTITPDIIADSVGLNADDNITKQPGDVVLVGGKEIPSTKYEETSRLVKIKSRIEMTKNRMAAEAFFNGQVPIANGKFVNLGLNAVGSVTKAATKSWITFMVEEVNAYVAATGYYPDAVVVGSDIASGMIKEFQGQVKGAQNFTVKKSDDGGMGISIPGLEVEIKTCPVIPSTVTVSNAATRMTLLHYSCLVPIYAGLDFVGTTGNTEKLKGDIFVGKTTVDEETATAKIYARSAPFPVIALPQLFVRKTVTIS